MVVGPYCSLHIQSVAKFVVQRAQREKVRDFIRSYTALCAEADRVGFGQTESGENSSPSELIIWYSRPIGFADPPR